MHSDTQDNTPQSFNSLSQLRAAHSDLMRAMRDTRPENTNPLTERIRDFVKRAIDAGAVLQGDDREVAQSIVDYWNTTLFTMPEVDRSAVSAPQLAPFNQQRHP